jgi:heme exporter protein CcmD
MNSATAHAVYLAAAYGATALLIGIELIVLRVQRKKLRRGDAG